MNTIQCVVIVLIIQVIEEIKEDIISLDTAKFYNKYLLGQEVWYFKQKKIANYLIVYDDFKHFVAESLSIHFNNIAIVGSAKIGYCLAPKKDFKQFDDNADLPAKERSDIDLVLVSPILFHKFWNAYLDLYNERKLYGYYLNFITLDVFRRFVSIKKPDPNHPTFKEWIEKVQSCNKDYQVFFDITSDINYRIYDSWESVENYHFKGIKEMKEKLINGTTG